MGKSGESGSAGGAPNATSSGWAAYRAGEQAGYSPTTDPFSYTGWEQSSPTTYASSMSPEATTSANNWAAGEPGTDWKSMLTKALAGIGKSGGGGAGYGIGAGGQAPAHVSYEQAPMQMGKLPFTLTPAQTEIARKAGAVLAALGAGQGGQRGA